MAMKLLTDAGVAVCDSRLLLLCDNPFRAHIARGLVSAGAQVVTRKRLAAGPLDECCDAVVVALRPAARPCAPPPMPHVWPNVRPAPCWSSTGATSTATRCPPPRCPCGRQAPPAPGHMAILPSAVGPEPIVRLQAGGLKVGEVLCRRAGLRRRDLDYLDPV